MHKAQLSKVLFYCVLLSLVGVSLHDARAQGASAELDGRFSQEGFLKIDGKARLIIGLYELPKSDEKVEEVAKSGFNLVRAPQDVTVLDRLRAHDLYAWICLGSAANLRTSDSDGERRLSQIVNAYKNHPSLLVWELPDEALWNVWWSRFRWIFGGQQQELRKHIGQATGQKTNRDTKRLLSLLRSADDYDERGLWKQAEGVYDALWEGVGVKNPHPGWKMSQCPSLADDLTDAVARGCRVIRQLDPQHIIWQNHAPRNFVISLREYNRAVDAAGCDIYPVPFSPTSGHSDLKDTNLSSVGGYTDRMREAAPGKSIWMVLQGFGWRDLSESGKKDPDARKGRRPSFSETRFMAYDAIVHGANAILYWGTHSIEKDSSLWRDIMKVARELRALESGIVGKRPKDAPAGVADETYGSIDGQGPRLMLRKAQDDWVLIAVNEHKQGIAFTIRELPPDLEGRRLHRLYSEEEHVVTNGQFHDGIRGFGVHVYATNRRFEVE